MPTNIFGAKDGGLRWDERLVRNFYLNKIKGLNDAARRHNSIYYAEKFAINHKWSGWISLLLLASFVMQIFDGTWGELQMSFFLLSASVYWWESSKNLQKMFTDVVSEIDARIAAEPELRERFASQQDHLNQQLEIQRREQQVQDSRNEVLRLQKQLESLHRDLGLAAAMGDPLRAGDIRARIARTESELRSRGH